MSDHEKRHRQEPETAAEEVLREFTDAEHRIRDTAEQRGRRGEAGEAITPNTRAQEDSEGQ